MTSTLPTRWQEILRREAADKVGNVLAQAKDQAPPRRLPRWTAPVGVIAVASLSLWSLLGESEARGRGSLPFDRGTLISTRTAGLGANAEDLAPSRKEPEALAPPSAAPSIASKKPAAPRSSPPQKPRCVDCDKRKLVEPTPTPPPPEPVEEKPPVTVPEKPAPLVVNIGTRLQATLTEPVITGAALCPVGAQLAADYVVGDRVALPAGTRLVGEAFATHQDDRVQVVFTAFVRDGKTTPLEAWALQDGEMGLKGKLIRKGSKGKKGAGTALGAAASALSFGLAGAASGPAGAALANLGSSASADLNNLGRDWKWSDKVVRVESGVPISVYVRRDLIVE
jgi:hypothetical protein